MQLYKISEGENLLYSFAQGQKNLLSIKMGYFPQIFL